MVVGTITSYRKTGLLTITEEQLGNLQSLFFTIASVSFLLFKIFSFTQAALIITSM